jgi:Arc/MetJ-type ribon-helix-helix transcriptional regulator
MKVSVSLPDSEVEFLDDYSKKRGLESRSAAVLKAVRMLRTAELGEAYAAAWEEWAQSGEAEVWDITVGDGLDAR